MEQLFSQLLKITKEKDIPQKDLQISLALFLTSATLQAKELTQQTPEEINIHQERFKEIESKLSNLSSEEELKSITQEIDSLMSKQGTSFQNEFDRIFEALIRDFIEKIK